MRAIARENIEAIKASTAAISGSDPFEPQAEGNPPDGGIPSAFLPNDV